MSHLASRARRTPGVTGQIVQPEVPRTRDRNILPSYRVQFPVRSSQPAPSSCGRGRGRGRGYALVWALAPFYRVGRLQRPDEFWFIIIHLRAPGFSHAWSNIRTTARPPGDLRPAGNCPPLSLLRPRYVGARAAFVLALAHPSWCLVWSCLRPSRRLLVAQPPCTIAR